MIALINTSFNLTEKAEATFTDVKASDWFYSDIAKAKAAGYVSGYSDGTFGPNQEINRQELAVIIGNLLKLKPTDSANNYIDTQNSPAWSKGAIGAVIDKAIMVGYADKLFQPSSKATRAEALIILDRSLKLNNKSVDESAPIQNETAALSIVAVVAASNTSILITFNQALGKELGTDAIEHYTITEQAGSRKLLEVQKATLLEDNRSLKLTTLAQQTDMLYELSISFLHTNDVTKKTVFTGVAGTGPSLISASSNDKTELRLSFDRALDSVSTETLSNYLISLPPLSESAALQVKSATLLSDHVTILIKTSSQVEGRIYTVKVSGIRDKEGNPVQSLKNQTTFAGTTFSIPSVVEVLRASSTSILVTFNLEMDQESSEQFNNYTINGVVIKKAELQDGKRQVKLTTSTTTQSKKYKLNIANVRAATGGLIGIDYSIEVINGLTGFTTGLIVSAAITSRTSILVQIDFIADKVAAENSANYTVSLKSSPGNNINVSKATLQQDGKQVVLTVAPLTSGALYSLQLSNLVDENRYPATFYNNNFNFAGDIIDLSITVEQISSTNIKLYFNQLMDKESTEAINNYTFSGGLTISNVVANVAEKYANITVTPILPGKIYTLSASNLKTTSGNSVSSSANFTGLGQVRGPQITSIKPEYNNVVVIEFDQELDNGSATLAANYSINNSVQVLSATLLPDGKSVKLIVSPLLSGQSYTVTLSNLKNSLGDSISDSNRTRFFAAALNPAIVELTAEALTNTSVKIHFNQALNRASAENTANYLLNPALIISQASYNVAEQSVILTVSPMTNLALYHADMPNITNSLGGTISAKAAFLGFVQPSGPRITNIAADTSTSVTVQFNQSLDASSATNISNYSIDGPITITAAVLQVGGDSVKLAVSPLTNGQLYTINVANIKNTNGLLMDSASASRYFTGVATSNPLWVITAISESNTTLRVIFNNEIDRTSASNPNSYSIGNNIIITNAVVQTSGREVTLTTSPLTEGMNYILTVLSVTNTIGELIDSGVNSANFVGMP